MLLNKGSSICKKKKTRLEKLHFYTSKFIFYEQWIKVSDFCERNFSRPTFLYLLEVYGIKRWNRNVIYISRLKCMRYFYHNSFCLDLISISFNLLLLMYSQTSSNSTLSHFRTIYNYYIRDIYQR